jgi:hypothetical protein
MEPEMAAPAPVVDSQDLLAALRRGPATLDALAARLGGPDREALMWALDEAEAQGHVLSSATDCGPDGLCATNAPTVVTLSAAGREAARPRR